MFSSTILDVVVGLIFAFLVVSLAASTFTEALASALKWRSSTLVQGIKDLLNDQSFTGLAQAIYTHALVSPLDNGTSKTEAEVKKGKSSILHRSCELCAGADAAGQCDGRRYEPAGDQAAHPKLR